MVSALESGSNDPGSSLDQGTALCSQARHFTLTVPLFTQVYKWVSANLPLEGDPAMDQHPIQGGVKIILVASCYTDTGISSGLMGHLARTQTLSSSTVVNMKTQYGLLI